MTKREKQLNKNAKKAVTYTGMQKPLKVYAILKKNEIDKNNIIQSVRKQRYPVENLAVGQAIFVEGYTMKNSYAFKKSAMSRVKGSDWNAELYQHKGMKGVIFIRTK